MSNPGITVAATGSTRSSYDHATITLHWLTAGLVVSLFASAQIWGFLAKGTALRIGLQSLHISFGILLAAIILLRIVWRIAHRHDLPPATTGFQELAAKIVHTMLYVLLCTQVTLGFLFRWSQQGEPFAFFGLATVPHVSIDPGFRSTLGGLHENVAWAIIIIASFHAAAALLHHYVLKDGVLARMLPTKN